MGAPPGRGEERALEVEPERLGAVGRARRASSARTRSAKAASSASGAVTAVGRNEVTPRRSRRRAMPSSAAASPIASWPPQPWTWTSTKPGARYGPSAVRLASSSSTAAIAPSSIVIAAGRDPVVEDQPAAWTARCAGLTARPQPIRGRARRRGSPRRSRRPTSQLRGHELDGVERRRPDAPPDLVADRPEQEVPGRRDAAADHDPVGRDDHDHVGDPDPEVAADPREALDRPRVARPRSRRPPPRPSRSRTPPRSGPPGRTPPGSRGCRSRTAVHPGRSSGARSRRPCRHGPGGPGRRWR